MDFGLVTEIIGIVAGGGIGALGMQLYTARVNKQKLAKEVEDAHVDIERKRQDNKQDAFDTMYQELSKCMEDYTTLSDNYRAHREKARQYEESVQEQIREKCNELAAMKAKIIYLKGIRCYDTLCPKRIKNNPDKGVMKTPDTDTDD